MDVELRKDLNIIPLGNDKNIIYAPLRGVAFFSNDKVADLCSCYIEGGSIVNNKESAPLIEHIKVLEEKTVKEPLCWPINTTSTLVVILSQMCNLACSYCYAQESRSKDVLSKEQVKTAVDFIMAKESKRKHFSFIGGGEPTLTWELLKWSIKYIRTYPFDQTKIDLGITTNGTLLDDEKIEFFQKNMVNVGLSFEILPDVQSAQRCYANSDKKTFDVIDEAIRKLVDKKVHLGFRSTITKLNVKRMPEMVNFVINNYPFLKKLHFEQVTSIDNDKAFYDDFISNFVEARKIGQAKGIDVYCSVSRKLDTIKNCFCGGELCLTPTGEFVACHRISSKEERAFDLFEYAKVKDNHVSLDWDKKERIEVFYSTKRKECASCFAKWHCAGSCAMERIVYSEEMRDLKCYFTKELIKELLIERLNPVQVNDCK